MLKSRIITSLVLFPVTIYIIFFLSEPHFALVAGVIILIGAYEWAGFAGFPTPLTRMAFVVIMTTIIYSIWLINFLLSTDMMNYIAAAFWMFSALLIFNYPRSASFWKNKSLIIAVLGLFLLFFTWYALISIHAIDSFQLGQTSISGSMLLLFCLLLIWSADIGAYFFGRRFGKNKLARQISPGKSWEGVYGGLVLAILVASVLSFFYHGSTHDTINIILISIVTVMFSVMGDLMESMFKRQAGIKDSGKILPGHGGILDRIDGVTAAAPVFFIALSILYNF